MTSNVQIPVSPELSLDCIAVVVLRVGSQSLIDEAWDLGTKVVPCLPVAWSIAEHVEGPVLVTTVNVVILGTHLGCGMRQICVGAGNCQ